MKKLLKNVFNNIKENFNIFRKPEHFLFLTRTSINGLIRYNKKRNYNSACHFSRPGIEPSKLKNIILNWSELLNKNNTIFKNVEYQFINSIDKNDILFLDPPYTNSKGIYYGNIEYKSFFEWITKQKGKCYLTFDGITNQKNYSHNIVPNNIFDKHIFLDGKNSSFNNLKNQKVLVKESLFFQK